MSQATQAIRYGPDAWLMHFAQQADESSWLQARAIVADLENSPPLHLLEWTLSPTALLLEFSPGHAPRQPPHEIIQVKPLPQQKQGNLVVIPTRYDGPDLDRVARHAQLTTADVIKLHSQATYLVHSLGFAPGFAYLGGLVDALHTPRLSSPRPRIEAGSVGIGGSQTAIYPLATSGGWNIIGHTSIPLFAPEKTLDQAFLLHPGDRVQFHIDD
jgi:KipI family sensor histidine kinase inhibitor